MLATFSQLHRRREWEGMEAQDFVQPNSSFCRMTLGCAVLMVTYLLGLLISHEKGKD